MSQTSAQARPALGALGKLSAFFQSIKVEHTVFALPFAYLSLFLASGGVPSLANFIWITVAMATARTFAMGMNRLIDVSIDASNPRTARRALPAGLISKGQYLALCLGAFALFLVAAYELNPIVRWLWPAVLFGMVAYPYGKRFTWACHLMLGIVYLMVPPSVWLAATGELPAGAIWLGFAAGCWVAGFDVIYTTQDVENDHKQRLHSLPADFGVARGLLAARLLHLLTAAFLLVSGLVLGLGGWYFAGVGVASLLLVYEHSLVSPKDLSRLNEAFFLMNGIISVVLFLFVLAEVLV